MRREATGVTLIELLVTISIMAILLAIATPSYNSTINGTRMSGEINDLLNSLNFARSEAVKRGLRVDVCPQNGAVCGSGVTDWSSGWYVLLDSTSTQLQILTLSTHTPSDTLTSTLTSYPYFTPTGYTFFTGTLSLHSNPDNAGIRRCIVFNAGSYTTVQGASCP